MVNDLTIVALLHIRSWKFASGRLPHVIRFRRSTLWHIDAGSGRRPPHQERPSQSARGSRACPLPSDSNPITAWHQSAASCEVQTSCATLNELEGQLE